MKFLLRNKLVRYAIVPVIAFVLLVVLGGGWYFAGVLEEDGLRVDNAEPENSVTVVALGDETITLKLLPDAEEDALAISARWGLSDGLNYGQLGAVLSDDDNGITREFNHKIGGFQVGDELYLDRTASPHEPPLGTNYEEVVIPGQLGEFGGWYIPYEVGPGHPELESDVWAIFVHGRTSNRDTSIKLMNSGGIHSLVIDYRNDEGAPSSESGYYDFGTTEWEDVEASVRYALDHGAQNIVLVGYSMGGGIVVNYQLKSELADRTVGIFLDSPMLNFGRTVDKGAAERSVPPLITTIAKKFASLRFGIDWEALDFLSQADKIDVPVLLIHGDADDTVPIETSIEFAESSPHYVQLHAFKDVGHVATWNHHPLQYTTLFEDFVERVR